MTIRKGDDDEKKFCSTTCFKEKITIFTPIQRIQKYYVSITIIFFPVISHTLIRHSFSLLMFKFKKNYTKSNGKCKL